MRHQTTGCKFDAVNGNFLRQFSKGINLVKYKNYGLSSI